MRKFIGQKNKNKGKFHIRNHSRLHTHTTNLNMYYKLCIWINSHIWQQNTQQQNKKKSNLLMFSDIKLQKKVSTVKMVYVIVK